MDTGTVTGDTIVQSYGNLKLSIEPLSALQEAGLKVALFVGIVGTLVIIGLVTQWMLQSPRMPVLPSVLENEQQIASAKEET